MIRAGINQGQRTWADIGAGTGNFTAALAELIGPDATLYAVDRNGYALRRLHRRLPSVHTIEADFTCALDLPLLDGVLMIELGFNEELFVDSELPDELMPQEYLDLFDQSS